MKVQDLDILRPEPKFVKIGGKEIDVSFIPCAITFPIDTIMQELVVMTEEEMRTVPEKTKRAFELQIKMCSIFCSRKYPEMDEEWFMDNTDPSQVQAFALAIREALTRAYSGIRTEEKNLKAPKKKSH
jgi:carbamoylphosphate synthase large subunit